MLLKLLIVLFGCLRLRPTGTDILRDISSKCCPGDNVRNLGRFQIRASMFLRFEKLLSTSRLAVRGTDFVSGG